MKAEINITIKVLDYWSEDAINRGYKPMRLFILIQIGNKLSLLEKEIN